MTNVEALKNLYVALGGMIDDVEDFNLSVEVINAIAGLTFGDSLPAVAAADKGKFLHTNESTGDLEWAAAASGGGVFVVTESEGTLNKTWAEIEEANRTGLVIVKAAGDASTSMVWSVDFTAPPTSAYNVYAGEIVFTTDSENGYPSFGNG